MSFPVMMIHGMCCTGEVWHNYRAFFEARGARVFTPTLRPQQRVRDGVPRSLGKVRLQDYVDDLANEVQAIESEAGSRPAIIGHSMGGLLAQLLVERGLARAGVFISPTAPVGARSRRDRVVWSALRAAGSVGLVPGIIRPGRGLLTRAVLNVADGPAKERALDTFVAESGRAFRDFATCDVDVSRIDVPVLTVAARLDRLVPARTTRLTGAKYAPAGGEFREYAEHGHWIYDEPGWEGPARDIFDWLAGPAAAKSHTES